MSPSPNVRTALRVARRPVSVGIAALVASVSLVATAVVPTSASASRSEAGPGGSHVVEPGDTLSVLAQRFGTTVQALAAANGVEDPDRIVAGATLVVPSSRTEVAAKAGTNPTPRAAPAHGSAERLGQRYEVLPGETLNGIASQLGIAASDLAAWNGIVAGRVYAGTRLVLWNPGTIELAGDRANVVEGSVPTCPVPGARFVNDWGYPRAAGSGHAGTDLFAPSGSPVVAPVAGTVTVETGTIGGLQFWLTAADGTRWFGSHLEAFGAKGKVEAGEVIGYVGDSGNAAGTRPHLHFELHPAGGMAANPYPLLRSIC